MNNISLEFERVLFFPSGETGISAKIETSTEKEIRINNTNGIREVKLK